MAKIYKIILDISGKRIELTDTQARELKDALADMFGGKKYVPQPFTTPEIPYPP